MSIWNPLLFLKLEASGLLRDFIDLKVIKISPNQQKNILLEPYNLMDFCPAIFTGRCPKKFF